MKSSIQTDTRGLDIDGVVVSTHALKASWLTLRLRISIASLFVCLMLPTFFIVISYIYRTNYDAYKKNAYDLISSHNDQTRNKLLALFDPISDSLLTLSKQVGDEPALFDSNEFHDTLLLHLENNPNLVSVFLASEWGSFHQIQRIQPGMIIAGRQPSADASYNTWVVDRSIKIELQKQKSLSVKSVSDKSIGRKSRDLGTDQSSAKIGAAAPSANSVFTFFKKNGEVIDAFVVSNNYEPRDRPFYKHLQEMVESKKSSQQGVSRFVFIDDPYIAISTKSPTFNISSPVLVDGKFIGMVGKSFQLKTISEFLKSIQISANCETYIVDTQGNIVVGTGEDSGHKIEKGVLMVQNLLKTNGHLGQIALQRFKEKKERKFEFVSPDGKEVYLALFTEFPNDFNKSWEVMTLVPVSDFLSVLNGVNRQLIIYGGIVCVFLVFITYLLSLVISRPIEVLTDEIRHLLAFKAPEKVIKSRIVEINILANAINNLRSSLNAFSAYIPRDLVRDLVVSGNAVKLGGESRYLTILFTDLEGFSTMTERLPSNTLIRIMSEHFELVMGAIKEEIGTVDKTIGDAVMAFWGAPLQDSDHALHACTAAVKVRKRMIAFNAKLKEQGLPELNVRIGIHTSAVLVGNVGSIDRMSYTVMGDGVNVAARLEGINKDYGTGITISHDVYREAGDRIYSRPIDVTQVKGRKGEVLIYELMGITGEDVELLPTKEKLEICVRTNRAYQFFLEENLTAAKQEYEFLVKEFNDSVAKVMLSRMN